MRPRGARKTHSRARECDSRRERARQQRRSNSWAFYQLRQFLEYKGIKEGVEVVTVSARYSSQTCDQCLHIHPVKGKSYRSANNFKCGHCGWKGDGDLNGAKMIQILEQSVSLPVTRNPLSGSVLDSIQERVRSRARDHT